MDALREGDAMSSEVSPESVSAVDEARALLVKTIPASQRTLGPDHEYTLGLQSKYGLTFTVVDEVSRDDLTEGVVMMEDILRKARRIFGVAHPQTKHFQCDHQDVERLSFPGLRSQTKQFQTLGNPKQDK